MTMTEQVKGYLVGDPLGKGLMALLAGVVTWLIKTVQTLTVAVAVQNAALGELKERVTAVQVGIYTQAQARSDMALVTQRVERLEQWSQNLSERMRAAERKPSTNP